MAERKHIKKESDMKGQQLCWNCKDALTLSDEKLESERLAKFNLTNEEIEEQKNYSMCSECKSDQQRCQTWNENFEEEQE